MARFLVGQCAPPLLQQVLLFVITPLKRLSNIDANCSRYTWSPTVCVPPIDRRHNSSSSSRDVSSHFTRSSLFRPTMVYPKFAINHSGCVLANQCYPTRCERLDENQTLRPPRCELHNSRTQRPTRPRPRGLISHMSLGISRHLCPRHHLGQAVALIYVLTSPHDTRTPVSVPWICLASPHRSSLL